VSLRGCGGEARQRRGRRKVDPERVRLDLVLEVPVVGRNALVEREDRFQRGRDALRGVEYRCVSLTVPPTLRASTAALR
jgi:hypothetical protein